MSTAEEVSPVEPSAERIERTREVIGNDLRSLIELGSAQLGVPDRDYVVELSLRTGEDKTITNREKQAAYLQTEVGEVGIDPHAVRLPEGKRLNEDLVTETLFSWIAAALTLERHPEREAEILRIVNTTILVRDVKRGLVESGAVKLFAQQGLSFFRNERSLPNGALKTLWQTLENSLKGKRASSTSKEEPL